MDILLNDIRYFYHSISAELVDKRDVNIYIRYWMGLIFGGKKVLSRGKTVERVEWYRTEEERCVWLCYIFTNDFYPIVNLCRSIDKELYMEAISFQDDWEKLDIERIVKEACGMKEGEEEAYNAEKY